MIYPKTNVAANTDGMNRALQQSNKPSAAKPFLTNQDLEDGLIFISPNGTKYRVTVANGGAVTSAAV